MIAQKVTFAFVNRLFINALGFVSLFFVAHYMGPETVGIISFALAYVGIFQNFSDFGFGSAHIKRVSEGKDFGKCNGTYFFVKTVLTVVFAVVVLATIFITKCVQQSSFISREHEIVLYIVLLSAVIGNLSMIFIITFGARKEIAKQQIPLLAEKIVAVTGKVIVALVGLGVIFLAGATLVSSIIALACFIWLFRDYPIKRPDKGYFKSYVTFALPVMFIGFLSNIAYNLDKVMIQFFGTTTDVGYYSAAQRISLVLVFITTASTTLIFPTISTYYSENRIGAIRSLTKQAERYLSMVFFPAVAFILTFSRHICLILLGTEFIASAPILAILAFVALINGTTQPYTQQMGGTNRIMLAAKLSSIVFGLNILLNILFIPQQFLGIKLFGMGGIGAALATLISMSIGALLFRYYAYRITASKPYTRTFLHLVSAVFMSIVLYYISASMYAVPVHYLMLFALLGIVIYVLTLAALREFSAKDLHFFIKILNPVQLKKYAVNEIKSGFVQNLH